MASSYGRESSHLILRKISTQKEWSSVGTGCQGGGGVTDPGGGELCRYGDKAGMVGMGWG